MYLLIKVKQQTEVRQIRSICQLMPRLKWGINYQHSVCIIDDFLLIKSVFRSQNWYTCIIYINSFWCDFSNCVMFNFDSCDEYNNTHILTTSFKNLEADKWLGFLIVTNENCKLQIFSVPCFNILTENYVFDMHPVIFI